MNILIVDDHSTNLKLLRAILEAQGYRVASAGDGCDALAVLQRERVDAIISDILMPRMDGYRFCYEVRKDERWRHLPFIFYTSTYTSPSDEKLALELTADHFIRKPAAAEVILDALHSALGQGRRAIPQPATKLDDLGVLKEYSERLVSKLEGKNAELAQANQELRDGEARLRLQSAALETAANAIIITDATGTIRWVNPAFTTLTGYAAEEAIGQTPRLLKSGQHDRTFYRSFWKTLLSGQTWRGEFINRRKDGSIYHDEHTVTPVRSEGGAITHFIGIMHDVTERKRAELRVAAFSSLGQKLNSARTAAEAGEIIVEVADQLLGWDSCSLDLYSPEQDLVSHVLNRDTLRGQRVSVPPAYDGVAPSPRARRAIEHGAQLILREEPYAMSDGVPFGDTSRPSASIMVVPIRDGSRVIGILSIQSYKPRVYHPPDLDALQSLADHCGGALDRIQAAAGLQESELKFRQLAESVNAVFWIANLELTQILYVSPAYERIWGRSCQSLYDRPMSFAESVHPADRDRLSTMLARQQRGEPTGEEYRIARPDGTVRWIRDRCFPIRNEAGEVYRVAGVAEDITERKQLEEQFRQAQKMEAIGQLAGGVAHDFNNMLAVIRGNAELVLLDAGQLSADARECLKQVNIASERAANLTRQLLAFGRKQVMQSQPLNLNDVIGNLTRMLNRIIGEDMQLQCNYTTRLPFVQADIGMMEQVLLNLVVNARDAMPGGGQLLIATERTSVDEACVHSHPEARVGEFISLSVTDTGTGIASEHLPRIFEPFYTTKEVGKGTGLGLATVFGIVKQHRGWIEVSTRAGAGSTFRILLPAIQPPAASTVSPEANRVLRGGQERILLVEDDLAVRLLTRRILEARGYHVVEAVSGREALEVWQRENREIDLLLTDIIMPDGVTGRELAEQLLAQSPALKVIFMSGYSADVVGKDTGFFRRTRSLFLQKPCSSKTLLEAIRQCLEEGPKGTLP